MKLIFKYIMMHLKSQLEYRSSFILSFIAQIIPIALSASMVFVLIDKFNFGDKYNFYEVMLGLKPAPIENQVKKPKNEFEAGLMVGPIDYSIAIEASLSNNNSSVQGSR